MTGVGSVADIVQLPDGEISTTDNATSTLTTTASGQRPALHRQDCVVVAARDRDNGRAHSPSHYTVTMTMAQSTI
jgi:hypothetical protein